MGHGAGTFLFGLERMVSERGTHSDNVIGGKMSFGSFLGVDA